MSITVLRWRAYLALVRFGGRVTDRIRRILIDQTWVVPGPAFTQFVDRVSPWEPLVGYRRRLLRRALYLLHYPMHAQRLASLRLVELLVYQLVERPARGRFEGFFDPADAIKAEWLYDHCEYANDEFGDQSFSSYNYMFEDLDVPWSRDPETWTMSIDSQGFVSASMFEDIDEAWALFGQERDAFDRLTHEDDEPDVDDEPYEPPRFRAVGVAADVTMFDPVDPYNLTSPDGGHNDR